MASKQATTSIKRREERAVMPLAGGIMQHGYRCGLVRGAALACE